MCFSLKKQPTFRDGTTGCTAKWRLRNEHRNSLLITRHYPDSGSVSDWLKQISHAAWPFKGNSLSKQPTFCVATTGFPTKWRASRTSVEIPYWWRVTTQIQAVLLIGWSKFLTRHDQSEAIVIRLASVYNGVTALFPWTSFRGESQWWHCEMTAVFSGYKRSDLNCIWLTLTRPFLSTK